MVGGKPVWDDSDPLWQIYGEIAQAAGLDWAGEWLGFKEYPHCQLPSANWRKLIKTAVIV